MLQHPTSLSFPLQKEGLQVLCFFQNSKFEKQEKGILEGLRSWRLTVIREANYWEWQGRRHLLLLQHRLLPCLWSRLAQSDSKALPQQPLRHPRRKPKAAVCE